MTYNTTATRRQYDGNAVICNPPEIPQHPPRVTTARPSQPDRLGHRDHLAGDHLEIKVHRKDKAPQAPPDTIEHHAEQARRDSPGTPQPGTTSPGSTWPETTLRSRSIPRTRLELEAPLDLERDRRPRWKLEAGGFGGFDGRPGRPARPVLQDIEQRGTAGYHQAPPDDKALPGRLGQAISATG